MRGTNQGEDKIKLDASSRSEGTPSGRVGESERNAEGGRDGFGDFVFWP